MGNSGINKGIPRLDSDELLVTDTFKNPVKISDSYLDTEDEGEVNTLWAEKADYLYEKNVGEGLKNIPYPKRDHNGDIIIMEDENGNQFADLSYKLALKPAQEEELGGVKLTGMFKPDKNGNPTINRDEFLATEALGDKEKDKERLPGFVKPDDSFSVGPGGELGLNPASPDIIGGVKVKEYEDYITPDSTDNLKTGLKMIGINNDVISVYTDYISKNIPQDLKDRFTLPCYDTNHKRLSENSLDGAFALLYELDRLRRKEYKTVKDELDYYLESNIDHKSIIFGSDTFNSNGCTIRFEKDLGDTDYSVVVKQTSITLADVGEISVMKYSDRCIVYNTGKNAWDTFNYLVIPSGVKYVDPSNFNAVDFDPNVMNNLPIAHGSSFFLSGNGSSEIKVPFKSSNYAVIVTPTEQLINAGKVGDFWIEKIDHQEIDGKITSRGFVVKCTGTEITNENKVSFDWVAVEYKVPKKDSLSGLDKIENYQYDRLAFPIRAGKCESKKVTETFEGKEIENVIASVDFSENLYYNKRYFIFPQLTSDGGGSIGEYSSILREKDRNGFKFDISGNASHYTMDWITIDNVPFPTYEDIHGIEQQLHERDEKLILQEEKLTKLENLVAELGNKVQAIEDRDNL